MKSVKLKNILFLSLLIYFCGFEVLGQGYSRFKKSRDVILSLGTGTTSYFGDLNDKGDLFDFSGNFNVGLQYFASDRISVRAEVLWFRLSGDDSETTEGGKSKRNLSFVSDNYELNAVALIQAFPEARAYYRRPIFNIYGFAGIGFLYFNPKAELNGKKHALQPLQTEGVEYSRTAIVIPYGMGIRYRFHPFFNLVVEGGFRQTFTDYLDDVSTVYVDNNSFEAGSVAQILADRRPEVGLPVASEGAQRGNPDSNDNYFLYNIKLEFYLPPGLSKSRYSKRYPPKRKYKRSKRRR